MFATVRELNRHFMDLWSESDTTLPDLGPPYPPQVQARNEKSLLEFLGEVDSVLSDPPHSREHARTMQARLGMGFRHLAEEALGFTAGELDLLPSQAFSDASEEFVRRARAFDPRLKGEDIYQAGRNAWTANGLQWLSGLPVQISPSILAYSLLYPYTDNYLDDPEIPIKTKRAFNARFHQRLEGDVLKPVNVYERVIFDLVRMIESQYPRSDHSAVFESLLAIHDAQSQSLDLLRRTATPAEVDVLRLSFYKGGTSVWADGFLVSEALQETQRAYTYGHGIFAQLLDDMEDIESDSQAGRLTLYSQAAGHEPLDTLANRTFHFGRKVLMDLDCFEVHESVRGLIRRGADLLLMDAIGRMDGYYTATYLRELEAYSPFRFSFLKEQRSNLANGRRHGSLVKRIEMLMLLQAPP